MKITWDEFLARDFAGCEGEERSSDGTSLRGPIRCITHENGKIKTYPLWIARKEQGASEWAAFAIPDPIEGIDTVDWIPEDIGDGRIQISHRDNGTVFTIFSKDDEKLDPAKVQGLVL